MRNDVSASIRQHQSKNSRDAIVVREGSATVKIYVTANRGRPLYTVVYYLGAKRVRQNFANLNAAKQEARQIAIQLRNGKLDILTLGSAEKENYVHAMALLRPLDLPLSAAVAEYARAKTILGATPLLAAAQMYVHSGSDLIPGNIPDIAAELLKGLRADKKDNRSVYELERNLNWFTRAFPGPIAEVDARQINAWLRSMKSVRNAGADLSARTRNNRREAVVTLFRYAQRNGYLFEKLRTAAEISTTAEEDPVAIGTFTPAEMQLLLNACPESLIPFLALGGLRVSAVSRY
ncbi:MAG: hypothetical protein H0U43_04915 [Chthoniobacterales bacterium]|nr:hypothetical protein [Chthoniobacterales bacterium]